MLKQRIKELKVVKKSVGTEITQRVQKLYNAGNMSPSPKTINKLSALKAEQRITCKRLYDRQKLLEEVTAMLNSEDLSKSTCEIVYGAETLMTEEIARQLP